MEMKGKGIRELASPRIGMFIVSDKNLNALNDFAMKVARNIVARLTDHGMTVFLDETVLTSQRAAEKAALSMMGQDLDAYLIYLPTWTEGPTAVAIVRQLETTPFLLWGFNMWEDEQGRRDTTGSVVGELVLKGTFERMGYDFKFVAGFPEDEDTLSAAVDYILAARARKLLKRVRFGQLGYTAIGMYPGTFDHVLMRRCIGPEIVPIPECEFQDVLEAVDDIEVGKLMAYIQGNFDTSRVRNEGTLARTARIYLAARKIVEEYELDGLNMRCHYDFSKRLRCTCCVPISLLSDERIVTGCEGDIVTSISMFMFDLLSDSVVTYGDILDFDRERNLTMFSACGYAPFRLIASERPALVELEYDAWGFAGILSSNVLKSGVLTFGRLFEKRGDYGFVYGTGTAVETELRGTMFPAVNVVLDGTVDELIKHAPTQHFALVYGNMRRRLENLLGMLAVEGISVG